MRRLCGGALLLLALLLPAVRALDEPKPADSAAQYKALVAEYQKAQEELQAGLREKFAGRFLELARKDPKDPAALDALTWVLNNIPGPAKKDGPKAQAVELILKDHVESDKLGPLVARLTYTYDKEGEALLQAIADKNPHREMQGQAVFGLAQRIQNQIRVAEQLKERPEMAKVYEQNFGEEIVKALREMDREKKAKEAEKLYERVVEKYADLEATRPGAGNLGKAAEAALKGLRTTIAVGKAAPEIEGEDIDGKKFKLSDYKGKVVLLDFWGHW
jgi:hypothetical protein